MSLICWVRLRRTTFCGIVCFSIGKPSIGFLVLGRPFDLPSSGLLFMLKVYHIAEYCKALSYNIWTYLCGCVSRMRQGLSNRVSEAFSKKYCEILQNILI